MPNSDYLIVLDLDGTLLTSTKKIPFLTKRYLRGLNKKGYKIVLASGRPARNISKFQNELKLTSPIIALNGLHIHYPTHNHDDRRIFFVPNKIKELTELVKKEFEINNIICETDKEIYITNKDAYLEPNFWLTNMKVVYGSLEENIKHPLMTFLIEMKDINFDQDKLKDLFKNSGYNVRCWVGKFQGYVEIFDENSNKAKAIKDIANELNVEINNVYAFGDDLNDIDMLKELPNAYVMKNAKDNIKSYSKHITKFDNKHQGVKKELKTILKNLK